MTQPCVRTAKLVFSLSLRERERERERDIYIAAIVVIARAFLAMGGELLGNYLQMERYRMSRATCTVRQSILREIYMRVSYHATTRFIFFSCPTPEAPSSKSYAALYSSPRRPLQSIDAVISRHHRADWSLVLPVKSQHQEVLPWKGGLI